MQINKIVLIVARCISTFKHFEDTVHLFHDFNCKHILFDLYSYTDTSLLSKKFNKGCQKLMKSIA